MWKGYGSEHRWWGGGDNGRGEKEPANASGMQPGEEEGNVVPSQLGSRKCHGPGGGGGLGLNRPVPLRTPPPSVQNSAAGGGGGAVGPTSSLFKDRKKFSDRFAA